MSTAESLMSYKTLRNIFIDDESNSIQLDLKHEMDDEKVEQIILKAVDNGYLNVVKGSDPRRYTVNFDKLVETWYSLWEEEIDERPVAPQNFSSFLKNYMKSYLEHTKHSTLKEMLVDKFYLGLNNQATNSYLSNDFIQLEEQLNHGFKGGKTPGEHIKYGIDHT